MDDPALGEYVTAESRAPSAEEEGEIIEPTRLGPPGLSALIDAERLAARVRELEQMMATTSAASARPPEHLSRGGPGLSSAPVAGRRTRGLFGDEAPEDGAALTAEDWAALRAVAGPAPGRLAGHERAPRPEALANDADLAELEADAIEDGLPEGQEKVPASLYRLILAQTQVLAKLAQPKATDPLTAALSNMTKEESFLGAKGLAARDAFVRVLGDNRATAAAVRRMGAEAMGVDVTTAPSNLMLDYVERKMPVGD